MNTIVNVILSHWMMGRKTHSTPSGWIAANAVCCNDHRSRGGLIVGIDNAVSYSCFNCGFKASWKPGRLISARMQRFMSMINISDDVIGKLSLHALRLRDQDPLLEPSCVFPTFKAESLPSGARPIAELVDDAPAELVPVLAYMNQRKLYLDDYPFHWSDSAGYRSRLIIPYYYNRLTVGYTARSINDHTKPKYLSNQQAGYVFNLDRQKRNRKHVVVCEGPLDAISIDGVAVLGAKISAAQNMLLQALNREIILVPDRDVDGLRTLEQALEYKWSVSMPDWPTHVKDACDAVGALGRLATVWSILTHRESSQFKIELRAKTWFKHI